MKIFNIPEWDDTSGLTHYATTWSVVTDSDGTNEIYRVTKSDVYLLCLDLNIEIPVGEVYYIKALRHLKDNNNQDVDYNNWIGPIKIINEQSNKVDAIIKDTYINTPHIQNIEITPLDGLTLTLVPYSGNVPLLKTRVIIESNTGTEIYSEEFNNNVNNINIPNNIYNFTLVESFILKIIYIGDLNTISETLVEKHSYTTNLYTLAGNLNITSPDTNTLIKIIPINNSGISVVSAVIKTLEGNTTITCSVNNNEVTILENSLEYNTTYNLVLELKYTDIITSNEVIVFKEHYVSTRDDSEVEVFNKDVIYIDRLRLVKQDHPKIIDNKYMLTEQSLYGVIPFISNGILKLYMYDENIHTFILIKDTGVHYVSIYFKIEFLPNNRFLVFYDNGDDYVDVDIYRYDYYSNNITLLQTHTDICRRVNVVINNFTLVGDRYYFYDYIAGSVNKLSIKYIDLINNTMVSYKETELTDLSAFTYCNVTLIDRDVVLIVPKSTEAPRTYMYDFTYDTLIKGPTLPSDFRNKYLNAKRLINGNILYTRHAEGDNKQYMIYDNKINKFIIKTFDITTDIYLRHTVSLKSGVYDFLIYESDGNIDIYRYE